MTLPTEVREMLINKIKEISGLAEDSLEVLNRFPGDAGGEESDGPDINGMDQTGEPGKGPDTSTG